jgi:ethanolamine transporter EutH
MFLVGLWHGASWNFIVWGLFHGCLLVVYRLIEIRTGREATVSLSTNRIGNYLKVFVLFNLIAIGWLLFRSDSILQAFHMLCRGLTDFGGTDLFYYCLVSGMVYILPTLLFEAWIFRSEDLLKFTKEKWIVQGIVYGVVMMCLMIFQPVGSSEFIYFRF